MKYKGVPISVLIDEAISDMGIDTHEINMAQWKRWVTDTYREFSTTDQLVHKIVLLHTDSLGKAYLPDDFKLIDQVSYRIIKSKEDCTTRERVTQWVQQAYDGCEVEINFKCDVCHKQDCTCPIPKIEVDIDYAWMKSNPWYYHHTLTGIPKNSTEELHRSYLTDKFTLLSYKGNSYFRLHYHIDNCENLTCIGCNYGYNIELPYMLTDLPPNTEILLSYFGEVTDENGDIMIPDQPDSLEAIKEVLAAKYYRIKFAQTGDRKYHLLYTESTQRGDLAIGRARQKLDAATSQEWRKLLSDVWMRRVRNVGPNNKVIQKDPYHSYMNR